MKVCVTDGCGRMAVARGLCTTCHSRWNRARHAQNQCTRYGCRELRAAGELCRKHSQAGGDEETLDERTLRIDMLLGISVDRIAADQRTSKRRVRAWLAENGYEVQPEPRRRDKQSAAGLAEAS